MFYKKTNIFPSDGVSNYRIPSCIATKRGTFIAFANDRKNTLLDRAAEISIASCRKEAGGAWTKAETRVALPDWAITAGALTYDEEVDKIIYFGNRIAVAMNEWYIHSEEELAEIAAKTREKEKAAGARDGTFRLVSTDDGKTWTEEAHQPKPLLKKHIDGKAYSVSAWTHGCAHGIQLKNGKYRGRLVSPARFKIGQFDNREDIKTCVYNCAIYSDDHGKTWQTSGSVQITTGEGTLIENADGSLTYNSRAYHQDGRRRLATSYDGGETWEDFREDAFLLEEKKQGCNASFIRVPLSEIENTSFLPKDAEGLVLFANPRAETRENMCICISYDGGRTWADVKVVDPGFASYSSLVWNRKTQTFCLLYEHGEEHANSAGISAIEFDLEWLLTK